MNDPLDLRYGMVVTPESGVSLEGMADTPKTSTRQDFMQYRREMKAAMLAKMGEALAEAEPATGDNNTSAARTYYGIDILKDGDVYYLTVDGYYLTEWDEGTAPLAVFLGSLTENDVVHLTVTDSVTRPYFACDIIMGALINTKAKVKARLDRMIIDSGIVWYYMACREVELGPNTLLAIDSPYTHITPKTTDPSELAKLSCATSLIENAFKIGLLTEDNVAELRDRRTAIVGPA